MRFDDSLATVLAADTATTAAAGAAWRQLVDLIGRGRAPADEAALARLRGLRSQVPVATRAASARALAYAAPPAALVGLFAEDELAVAAPVLRIATLPPQDWCALLSGLGPAGRSVLRHRRDLSDPVRRGLESFGATDFVIAHDPAEAVEAPVAPVSPEPAAMPGVVAGPPETADVAVGWPPAPGEAPRFEIADLIARIDGFTREQPEGGAAAVPTSAPASFLYETDAAGIVRWVEGVARSVLVGASLAGGAGAARLDAVAAGALRRRDRFADARLEIDGDTPAAGSWRLSGTPQFDRTTGRFVGMRGVGRRARRDQRAEAGAASDQLRQLVHELRTPANAIAGFAELIESELLGPVPVHYRARAHTIRDEADALLVAVEDLDTAARIDARALDLRPATVPVAPLLARITGDLQPLAFLRGVTLLRDTDGSGDGSGDGPGDGAGLAIAGDDRAVERLVARLLGAAVAAGGMGERLGLTVAEEDGAVAIAIDRPRALATDDDPALFRLDAPADGEAQPGAPLLGIGFTLRLVRNLAAELGGRLAMDAGRLTLHLPAASDREVQATAI